MNIGNTQIVVEQAISKRLTPILWGKHGIGKSQVVSQLAERMAKKEGLIFTSNPKEFDDQHFGLVDLRLGQMEVGDLIGMPCPDAETRHTDWYSPLWFPHNLKSRGVIFLDELNRGRLDVIQAVFQLVWDRRLATHTLPDGWGIVVACNPAGADYFVNEIDPALMDRFVHIKLTPEVKEWVIWAKNYGNIKTGVTDFIEKYPEMLGNEGRDANIEIKPSPRSWQVLNSMLDGLDEELWLETAMGIIGNECAIPFLDSLKINMEKPIRAKQILDGYPKWKSKIKKFGDKENSRFDLLRISVDDIERVLKKEFVDGHKNLEKVQEENLVAFMRDLPSDLTFSMIKTICDPKIMGTNKFNELLNRYNDLYLLLEKVADLG